MKTAMKAAVTAAVTSAAVRKTFAVAALGALATLGMAGAAQPEA